MRKTLLTFLTLLLLGGLFTGSWYLTSVLRDDAAPVTSETVVSVPGDDQAVPSTESATTAVGGDDQAVPSTESATTAVGGVAAFTLPTDVFDLERKLQATMQQFGANMFSVNRVFTYATIAWYEALGLGSSPTFIAAPGATQDEAQAMLAAGAVVAQLLDTPQISTQIEAWKGELSERSSAVVDAVVAFADSDGFDSTAGATAPTFEGEFGWKPGGSRLGAPAGYEPAYGQVRTIALDIAACPVQPAPLDAIRAEREALTDVGRDVPPPTLVDPTRFSTLGFIYMNRVRAPDMKAPPVFQGQNLAVMLHDSLIATWKANWENGVAAPLDILAPGDASRMSSNPSYPAWIDVAVAMTETYVSGVIGEEVSVEQMIDFLIENHDSNALKDQLGLMRKDIENSSSAAHHWNADRAAGRDLGNCIAGEALRALSK